MLDKLRFRSRKISKEDGLVAFIVVSYFLVFSLLSVLKHFSLHSTYLDLGLESQVVWNTSQGRFLESSFGKDGQLISALSFHVSPISVLLSPLYFIWGNPVVLLLVQTALLALSGLPVYWFSKAVTKSRMISITFLMVFFLYPPLEYSNLSDFHPQTIATFTLLFTLWFLHLKKYVPFFIFFFLSLITKENISLVLALISLYLVFGLRKKCTGSVLLLTSLIWFFVCVYLIIPFFSGGEAGALGRYNYLGKSLWEIILYLLTNPIEVFKILVIKPKIMYILHLLVSVGFLPLLAPSYVLFSVSELFLNLFSSYNPQWQVKFHYTAAITPFILFSAVLGARKLVGFLKLRGVKDPIRVVSFYLIFAALSWNVVHSPSPFNFKFDRSVYEVKDWHLEVLSYLYSVPSGVRVSAMNNLGAHLSTRRFLFRFPVGIESADLVVVDPKLSELSYDLSQVRPEDYRKALDKITSSEKYRVKVNLERLLVFERIEK